MTADATNTSIPRKNRLKTFRFVAIALACVGCLMQPGAVSSDQLVTIKVTPSISQAPAAIVVRTSVEPHQQNRILRVSIESDDFYSSSDMSLDGDQAPKVATFRFRNVPRGSFEVTAELGGVDGRHGIISRTVRVISPAGE
jgi:hypothetical protein